jgi:hypothetical protein
MIKKIVTALACIVLAFQVSGFSGPVPPQNPPPLGPEVNLTVSGPDEYGYTLSDEGALSFVDISSTGTSIYFSNKRDGVVPLSIREFDYYSWLDLTTAYVSVNGFISFEPVPDLMKSSVPKVFPTDSKPNSLLAPFWYDLTLETGGGVIYYLIVDDPDPSVACTIIQWNNVRAASRDEFFTFEIILYDSGDIVFAYQPEVGTYAGATAGLEDVDGVAGLNYAIPDLTSGETVVITRPDPGSHLKARPQISSGFFTNGEAWLSVDVSNTTDSAITSDSYSLVVELLESDPDGLLYPWGLTFYDPTCTTEITSIDDLANNTTTQLCMHVTAGGDQVPGYYARFRVTLTSQADPSRSSVIYLQTAIDSPFAQLYQDDSDGLLLDMNHASGQTSLDVAAPFNGSDISMNMLRPGYYIISWVEGSNIYYRLYSQYPGILGAIHSIAGSPPNAYNPDLSPAVAGSRDGYTGILYLIDQYQVDGLGHTELNSNVWYALIDGNGNLVDGYPTNLTNNASYLDLVTGYPTDEPPIPQFSDPRIVPVGQDKLGLVWNTNYSPAGSYSMDKIDYLIAMTDGSFSAPQEIPGWSDVSRHVFPAATPLDDGRFIISYINYTGYSNPWLINYTVINTDGSESISSTPIAGTNGWMVDLVQLATGQVLFGWQDIPTKAIHYAILASDLASFDVGVTSLSYEDYPGHQNYRSAGYPSVTRSANGTGVITWQDQDWQEQLYYALIGSDGSFVTPPSLYRRVNSTLPKPQISSNAYGNAPLAGESIMLPVIYNNYVPKYKYYFTLVCNPPASP